MTSPFGDYFRYGSPWPWTLLTLGIGSLGALEVAVGVLVVDRLVPQPWAGLIDITLIAATTAVLVVVASPLASRIRLGADALVVPFGLLGHLRVPLDAIESLSVVPATTSPGVPLGLDIEHDAFSVSRGGASGQVRVVLTRPVTARLQAWRTAPVSGVHLAVEDPQGLAASLRQHSPTMP